MTTARSAKPSYRLTNMSSTMHVPLLIIIAPNRGVHPHVRRGRTCVLQRSDTKHATPPRAVNLPGSQLNLRQRTMRVHMNDPKMRTERYAADIAVEATRISPSVQSVRLKHERNEIRNKTSEIQISILFPGEVK